MKSPSPAAAAAQRPTIGGRSITSIRGDFPILSRRIGAKPLAYLDNAATSQKPRRVLEALTGYYEHSNANVHRALHTLGEEATAAYEESRAKVARFIGAPSPAGLVFTRGTTEAINLVASSWGGAFLKAGDIVLLTGMEHHANIVPWQLLAERTGAVLRFVPVEPDGSLDLDALERRWDERVRLFSLTHMSNVLGTVNDVRHAARIAHAHGALVLIDAAQSVPHMRVDVAELDCDFFAFSGHKMCGPMGIGGLWARPELLSAMPPYMGGGEMIRAVWLERSTWNDPPHKFEAGTPNVEGAVGLAAAADYLEELGMEEISAYEEELARLCLSRLQAVPGVRVFGTSRTRGPVFSFTLEGVHAHDVAQVLDGEGVAVRAGHHCAQPLARALGVTATARASLSFYNEAGEIERLAAGLETVRRLLGP